MAAKIHITISSRVGVAATVLALSKFHTTISNLGTDIDKS
jgi:hypothetical protein